MVLMLAPVFLDHHGPVLLSAAEISEISTRDGKKSRLLGMRVSLRRLRFLMGGERSRSLGWVGRLGSV